jgi:hypothetical protein
LAADPTIFLAGWRLLVPVCKVDGATAVFVQTTTFIDCQRAFLVKAALMSRRNDSSRHMQPYLPIVVQQSALRNSARLVSFSFFAGWIVRRIVGVDLMAWSFSIVGPRYFWRRSRSDFSLHQSASLNTPLRKTDPPLGNLTVRCRLALSQAHS